MNINGLPPRMQTKIHIELAPVAGVDGFCWTWIAAVNSRGYGSFGHEGRIWSTHRLTYTLLVGEIPTGLQIDHLCSNKRCCNPSHLEPVTAKVNRSRTAQAQKTMCKRGHPLSGSNLIVKSRPNGLSIRNCRECANESRRRKPGVHA